MPDQFRIDRTRMESVCCDFSALQPPGQLPGEEHVGQFAVTVGEATIVALLTMEVMEADSASVMSQRGHIHMIGRAHV